MDWRTYSFMALAAARITALLLVRRRRILFLGLLALIPALLPVIVAALRHPGSHGPSGLELYALIAEYGYLGTLVPLGAILLGTALMGDDLETGTATYLLTRPAPRSALVLGKALAYAGVMAGVFLPAMALTCLSAVATSTQPGEGLWPAIELVSRTFAVVCLAIVAYGGLCGLLGALVQRPVIYAVMFVFGWEPLTRIVPGYVDFLTIKKHLLALWPSLAMGERAGAVEVGRRVIDVGVGEALLALTLVTVAFLAATTLTLRKREFVRGQTLG